MTTPRLNAAFYQFCRLEAGRYSNSDSDALTDADILQIASIYTYNDADGNPKVNILFVCDEMLSFYAAYHWDEPEIQKSIPLKRADLARKNRDPILRQRYIVDSVDPMIPSISGGGPASGVVVPPGASSGDIYTLDFERMPHWNPRLASEDDIGMARFGTDAEVASDNPRDDLMVSIENLRDAYDKGKLESIPDEEIGNASKLVGFDSHGMYTTHDATAGGTGPAGPRGPMGLKGDKGDTGDTGPAGPQGEQGIQGPVGPQGEKGDAGSGGITGDYVKEINSLVKQTKPHSEDLILTSSNQADVEDLETAVLHDEEQMAVFDAFDSEGWQNVTSGTLQIARTILATKPTLAQVQALQTWSHATFNISPRRVNGWMRLRFEPAMSDLLDRDDPAKVLNSFRLAVTEQDGSVIISTVDLTSAEFLGHPVGQNYDYWIIQIPNAPVSSVVYLQKFDRFQIDPHRVDTDNLKALIVDERLVGGSGDVSAALDANTGKLDLKVDVNAIGISELNTTAADGEALTRNGSAIGGRAFPLNNNLLILDDVSLGLSWNDVGNDLFTGITLAGIDLDDHPHGRFDARFALSLSNRSVTTVGFNDGGQDQTAIHTEDVFASDISALSAFVSSGTARGGVVMFRQDVYSASTHIGTVRVYAVKDSNNVVGVYGHYHKEASNATFNINIVVKMDFDAHDAPAPAPSSGGLTLATWAPSINWNRHSANHVTTMPGPPANAYIMFYEVSLSGSGDSRSRGSITLGTNGSNYSSVSTSSFFSGSLSGFDVIGLGNTRRFSLQQHLGQPVFNGGNVYSIAGPSQANEGNWTYTVKFYYFVQAVI